MRGLILLLLVSSPAIADDKVAVKKLAKGGAIDCAKDPHVSIGNGMGTYTFKGTCASISVGGGMNTLTIESVDVLDVGGAKNTITVDTIGTVKVTGAMNTIAWKKAKTGDKPTLKGQPDKNTITLSK